MPESADDLLRSVWPEAAPELSRLVCAMGVGPDRAEDVLQDVYLTALGKPPPATDRLGLRRWLVRVTVNRCNLEHRRRARWRNAWRKLARPWGRAAWGRDPAAEVGTKEERAMVRRALDRLEPPLRSVLVMRYFAELDSKEIGMILEMPGSTVRSHLRRARRQLALELRRAGYTDE